MELLFFPEGKVTKSSDVKSLRRKYYKSAIVGKRGNSGKTWEYLLRLSGRKYNYEAF